jgi:hypothetical protein
MEPSKFNAFVIDGRTLFVSAKLPTGGSKAVGFGVIGLTAATVINHQDKRKHTAQNAGQVAVGHIRHEWFPQIRLRRIGVANTNTEELRTRTRPLWK